MSDGTNFFFCKPLREGAIFAGNFSLIVSMIACALAFSVFFRESENDDEHSKLLSFSVSCYTIFYIAMCRGLIRGVKDMGKFQESSFMTFTVLGATALCTALSAVLVYCIWGVARLWRLYGGGETNAAE